MNQKTEHEVATGTETWEGEVNNLDGADKIAWAAIITSRSCHYDASWQGNVMCHHTSDALHILITGVLQLWHRCIVTDTIIGEGVY